MDLRALRSELKKHVLQLSWKVNHERDPFANFCQKRVARHREARVGPTFFLLNTHHSHHISVETCDCSLSNYLLPLFNQPPVSSILFIPMK